MGNSQPKIDPKEQARQHKRTLQRAIRQIERERTKLQNQEAKTLKQIKDLAVKNQHGPAKLMSKDLVRSRAQVNMYYTMASQMKVIETQLAAAGMNAQMMESLKGVNQVMAQVNGSMNVQQMNQVMRDFAKETEKMNMQQEMMQDNFEMLEDPDQENQAEEVYSQILGEIGMQLNGEMQTGSNQISNQQAAAQPDNL